MNPRTLQIIAFALGCILALQSAPMAFAQNAAPETNTDPQQPVASTPVATATPANPAPDSATSSGSQGTSPDPQTPDSQTQDPESRARRFAGTSRCSRRTGAAYDRHSSFTTGWGRHCACQAEAVSFISDPSGCIGWCKHRGGYRSRAVER